MKIALCHPNPPESIFNKILKMWPMYSLINVKIDDPNPEFIHVDDYSKIFIKHQRTWTDMICDAQISNWEKSHILYNATMLNVLSDTLIAADHNIIDDEEFISSQFSITKHMFKFLDIIFWLNPDKTGNDDWEISTNNIFKSFNKDYWEKGELVFPAKDTATFIEVPYDSDNEDRSINVIAEYINSKGDIFEPEGLDLENELKDLGNILHLFNK